MAHLEYKDFKKKVGDLFDGETKAEATRLIRFKRCMGQFLLGEIKRLAPRGGVEKAKHRLLRYALDLTDTPRPEDKNLAKLFTNIKAGGGASDAAFALYFFCHKAVGFEDICAELDAILVSDDPKTFWADVGSPPTKEFHFEDIVNHPGKRFSRVEIQDSFAATSKLDITDFFNAKRYDNDLHYTTHVVEVLGREEEQEALRAFLVDERSFCWLQLAGAGGQGKSRLAFDLVTEATFKGWDAGFLTEEGLVAFEARRDIWEPTQPTLIVIDYVLGKEGRVAPFFRTFVERKHLKMPVRLLLLERQRWDRGGLERFGKPLSTDEPAEFQPTSKGLAQWFLNISGKLSPDDKDISNARFGSGVIELTGLKPDELVSLVKQIAAQKDYHIALSDNKLKQVLARIDQTGRPLFAYLLAYKLADGDYDEKWTREDLLTVTLERDQKRRWQAFFYAVDSQCPSLDDNGPAIRLARLATMIDGFDASQANKKLLEDEWVKKDSKTCKEALVLVDGPHGSGVPFSNYVPPLQPALLGEWFVLWAYANDSDESRSLALAAWQLDHEKMLHFVCRCIQDFPLRRELHHLLDVYPVAGEVWRGPFFLGAPVQPGTRVKADSKQTLSLWKKVAAFAYARAIFDHQRGIRTLQDIYNAYGAEVD